MAIIGLGNLAVKVGDLDAAVTFYRRAGAYPVPEVFQKTDLAVTG